MKPMKMKPISCITASYSFVAGVSPLEDESNQPKIMLAPAISEVAFARAQNEV